MVIAPPALQAECDVLIYTQPCNFSWRERSGERHYITIGLMCSSGGGGGEASGGGAAWRRAAVFLGAYLSCQRRRDDRVLHLTASRSNNCESRLSGEKKKKKKK